MLACLLTGPQAVLKLKCVKSICLGTYNDQFIHYHVYCANVLFDIKRETIDFKGSSALCLWKSFLTLKEGPLKGER